MCWYLSSFAFGMPKTGVVYALTRHCLFYFLRVPVALLIAVVAAVVVVPVVFVVPVVVVLVVLCYRC